MLGEILDIGAVAEPNGKLVVVFVSEGGSLPALLAFMECVLEDAPTRALIERCKDLPVRSLLGGCPPRLLDGRAARDGGRHKDRLSFATAHVAVLGY